MLAATTMPLRAERNITCESDNYRYRYCRADTDDQVRLVHQRSRVSCREGENWGYDRHGVWVDRGCAAEFSVGHRGSHGGSGNAVAAGAAVAGLVALMAIASSKKSEAAPAQEVSSWAVGSFSGYDEVERTEVKLTILPGGSVQGQAGRTQFSGSFSDPDLVAGRHRFRVQRSGNGFVATDVADAGHRVVFQRSGSGY
jgi:hypothetical protein